MHERHAVGQAHHLVLDIARLLGMELLEHGPDQAHVLGDGLGPDLVADDNAADHATPPWGLVLIFGFERQVSTHAV